MARRLAVGARELKTRLGTYLQQVRQGRTLVITDRGEPVAELRPIAGDSSDGAVLKRLEATGAVTCLEQRALRPFRPVGNRGAPVSDAILQDRDRA